MDFPDFLGSAQRGYAFGDQLRQNKQAKDDEAQLRALAPAIVQGDLAAYGQAAAIDPAKAAQYQGAGDVSFKRLAGAYKLVDDARKTNDIRAVNAALRQTAPFFSQVLGKPVPTEWAEGDPAWEEGWGKLGQQIAMAQTGGPRGPENKVVGDALVDPVTGKVIYQAPERPVNGQVINVPDGNGGTVQMIFDPKTRQLSEPQYPGQAAPATSGPSAGLPSVPGGSVADVQSTFRDVGQRLGFEISSMQRPVIAAGAGARSQHPNGTAADYSVKGKTRAQVEQLMAELRSDPRLEVIDETDGKTGTGPHVHVELRPGVQVASAGGGLGYTPPKPDISPYQEQTLSLAQQAAARADRAEQRSVAANAVTGKPPTEGERKAATLLTRMTGSLAQLEQAVKDDPDAASPNLLATAAGSVLGETAANKLTPAARQRVESAQLDILDAALTLGTGAAYTKEQLEGYRKSYFPQIGDSQANIQDKAARLKNVIEAAKIAAGRAAPAPKTYSVGQTVEHNGKVYRVVGGDPADPDLEEVR